MNYNIKMMPEIGFLQFCDLFPSFWWVNRVKRTEKIRRNETLRRRKLRGKSGFQRKCAHGEREKRVAAAGVWDKHGGEGNDRRFRVIRGEKLRGEG